MTLLATAALFSCSATLLASPTVLTILQKLPSIALLPLLHVTKAQQILDYLATGTATIIGKLRTCAFSLDFNVRIFYIYFVPAAL